MPTASHYPDQPVTDWPWVRIPPQPRLAAWLIVLTLFIKQLLVAYFQLLAYPNAGRWFPPMVWLSSATGGIVDGTLVCGVTLQLILFPIFLFWLGRLRPKDVGLDLTNLSPAIQRIVLIWIACQVLHIAILLLMVKPIEVNPAWGSENWRFALSDWFGQLFGNCPFEEVLFRGFLLPQCLLLAMHWLPESKRWKHLVIALLLSQGLFAFSHIIFNMKNSEGQWLLIGQFVMGLLFSAIYLRTGNLFLAIGVHALINNPAPLLRDLLPGPGLTGAIVLVGCLLWLCISPWWKRSQQTRV
ncbi:MAG: lysostaphin resistance A-like protein [Pirellula sp.]